MKKRITTIFTLAALTIATVSCKDKAKEATTAEVQEVKTEASASQKYIADAAASSIQWKGNKPGGSHNGTIKIENGVLSANGDKIESGSFLINMGSIVVEDIPADDKMNGKLLGHLKDADFFDVEAHPNAAFEITGSTVAEGKTMLSGNLSIKGIKHNITFPVSVTNDANGLTLTSETFTIDRTKWDIKYKSKSVFGDLGDKFINDDIELKITVKAAKA
ncbi:YceI family protein [Postechiella marina]|uniref:YceI family protein n=1 Tax=Postechiella marina TaxID=943941 RepID=A0ABP8CCU5_9FLAO